MGFITGRESCSEYKVVVIIKTLPNYLQVEFREIQIKRRKISHLEEDAGAVFCDPLKQLGHLNMWEIRNHGPPPVNTETITQIVYDDTYSQIPPHDYLNQ